MSSNLIKRNIPIIREGGNGNYSECTAIKIICIDLHMLYIRKAYAVQI